MDPGLIDPLADIVNDYLCKCIIEVPLCSEHAVIIL